MAFILESMGLHGNKIFDIKGNFINFKLEKKILFPRVVFVIFDFKEGRTRNYQKIR